MRTVVVLSVSLSLMAAAAAQAAGQRGATQEPPLVLRLQPPDDATAERVITIEAVGEVRAAPSALRVVCAVSSSAATAAAASIATRELVATTSERLAAAGVAADAIDVDFIAAVPVFAWQIVTVADEAAARAAIEAATATDGVELLAVDYWSDTLAEQQVLAQQRALAAAQAKAKLLLAVFPEPPRPINVHESTKVLFPQQLYHHLARAEDSATGWYSRDNLPRVPASRPLQVYYRGLFADVDAPDARMPGKRDIEIVSTVRLYFVAPERPAPAK